MRPSSSLLRLGHLRYVNALPIYAGLARHEVHGSCLMVQGCPTQLNSLLLSGELDVSLVSSIEYLRHQDRLTLLPGLCIAAQEEVRSALLHVKGSLKELDGCEIGVTTESASTAQLLQVLCENFWQIRPKYVPINSPSDFGRFPAVLLIGDQALLHPQLPGYEAIDLASAWNSRTLLPFTFAVFAARKEVVQERGDEVLAIARQLELSLAWGQAHSEIILQMAMAQSRLARRLLEEYYALLRYRLGRSELDALRVFASMSRLPIPSWQPPAKLPEVSSDLTS